MNVVGAIQSAITQCGRECALESDGRIYRFTACIMPVLTGGSQGEPSRFGVLGEDGFLYYGPVSGGGEHAREGTVLTVGGERYELLLCREFHFRDQPVFRRAQARRIVGGGGIGSV